MVASVQKIQPGLTKMFRPPSIFPLQHYPQRFMNVMTPQTQFSKHTQMA